MTKRWNVEIFYKFNRTPAVEIFYITEIEELHNIVEKRPLTWPNFIERIVITLEKKK